MAQIAVTAAKHAWGRPPTAVAVAPTKISLASIQLEQQQLADDLALAIQLQVIESARGGLPEDPQPTTEVLSAAPIAGTESDEALAAILQAELDAEHDRAITQRERRINRDANMANSKVSISLARHRAPNANLEASAVTEEAWDGSEDEQGDVTDMQPVVYDRLARVARDGEGEIVTKHNESMCNTRNCHRMDQFPVGFLSGDTSPERGGGGGIKLNNRVFNALKRHAVKADRAGRRLHEKKENATSDLALDSKTRLVIFHLIGGGFLETVSGAISTGKEAVVLRGRCRQDPEDPTSPIGDCALKVFKTTLTEFKERQQFLHGDRRFEARVGRQSARKLVKLWAEKEMANLIRMHRVGLPCPAVLAYKKHVLVMSFIGRDGIPAPKLKEMRLSPAALDDCFAQCQQAMVTMYTQCRLVHGDLSEYNMLYHDGRIWLIDVGQAVEPSHPRASAYLYRDCNNVTRFFRKQGATAVPSAAELFSTVCGLRLSSVEEAELLQGVEDAKGAPRAGTAEPHPVPQASLRDTGVQGRAVRILQDMVLADGASAQDIAEDSEDSGSGSEGSWSEDDAGGEDGVEVAAEHN